MGQQASSHKAKNIEAALGLSISGIEEVNVLRYSGPAPLPVQSIFHSNTIDSAEFTEALQDGLSQPLPVPSTVSRNAIRGVPVEVFLKIADYLSPVSVRSLSYTCRSLHEIFDASAATLMGEPPRESHLKLHENLTDDRYRISMNRARHATEPGQSGGGRENWLELLFLLKRGGWWPGKAVCSACVAVHDKAFFHPGSFEEEEEDDEVELQCLGSVGYVWICPHNALSYHELKKMCNSLETYDWLLREEEARSFQYVDDQDKEIMAEDLWTTEKKMTCDECWIPVTITSWAKSRVCVPLAMFGMGRWKRCRLPSASDFASHLEGLDMPICPHKKLSSPSIMDAYCQERKPLGNGWSGSDCNCRACSVLYHECALCQARFWFDIGDWRSFENVIHLVVERSFDPSVGITDPKWINQLFPLEAYPGPGKPWWFDPKRCVDSSHYRGPRSPEIIFGSLVGYVKGVIYPMDWYKRWSRP